MKILPRRPDAMTRPILISMFINDLKGGIK